jgi:transposase
VSGVPAGHSLQAREPGASIPRAMREAAARAGRRRQPVDPADQARLNAAREQCPHLDALTRHVRDFAKIMTRRQGLLELEDWLARAEASDLPQLRSFAHGIRRDQQAVTAGLSLPYSSAVMEGNVNKIKMIKRQMYGRAGFPLLRKRVIHHPA